MKLAIAQINTTVGDFDANVAAIGGVVTFTNLAHPQATNITIAFTSGVLTATTSSVVAVSPDVFSKFLVLLPR